MNHSHYTRLDPKTQEIRLLDIAPGNHDDDSVISLRKKKLTDRRPKFNALSYAWGKEKFPRTVLLNGRSLAVGLSPEGALHRLRRSYSGRLLWVDALCINKEDVKEWSQQA